MPQSVNRVRGVSPVIGVILLVAVTVVLSAAVFVVLSGMIEAGTSGDSASAGVKVAQTTDGDNPAVKLTVVTGDEPVAYKVGDNDPVELGRVGATETLIQGTDYEEGDRITILNSDGESVIQTVDTANLDSSSTVSSTTTIGEVTRISLDADLDGSEPEWRTVDFQNTYDNPVIVAKHLSYNGGHPAHVRVKDVTGSSADLTVEEWNYLDDNHAQEDVAVVVMEAGQHTLPDGTLVEAGHVSTDHNYATVSFSQSFGATPVVFTQSQTYNGPDPIVTRNDAVTTSDFNTKVQEEEAGGSHTTETIGYIAIEPVTGTNDGRNYEIGRTPNTVTHNWYTIDFDQSYDDTGRAALLDMQTEDGGNTAGLRWDSFTSTSIDTFVEEEQSSDDETDHTDEVVGYWVFDGAGDIRADE